MGLWFWKPGEAVNPQQPLSAQLYGQGDPGEGWSQSRSATPASLADSYGGSGACSFDAPNRANGFPDFTFGMDVQLYGAWSQAGKVTSVETDGDYTSYVVDDVLARLNKNVEVAPLMVGYTGGTPVPVGGPWETHNVEGDGDGGAWVGGVHTGLGGGAGPGGVPPFDTTNWDTPHRVDDLVVLDTGYNSVYAGITFEGGSTYVTMIDHDGTQLYHASYNDIVCLRGVGADTLLVVRTNQIDKIDSSGAVTADIIQADTVNGFVFRDVAADRYQFATLQVRTYPLVGTINQFSYFVTKHDWPGLGPWGQWGGVGDPACLVPDISKYPVVSKAGSIEYAGEWSNGGSVRGTVIGASTRHDTYSNNNAFVIVYSRDDATGQVYANFTLGLPGEDVTLRDAYVAYIMESGTPTNITFRGSSAGVDFSSPVAYPDWEGNLLDRLGELAAVTRTQFKAGTLPGDIDVSGVAGFDDAYGPLPDNLGGKPQLSLGTDGATESYTIKALNARLAEYEIVYTSTGADNVISFTAGETQTTSIQTPHSLMFVTQPEPGSNYTIEDGDGVDVSTKFRVAGGSITARVSPLDHSVIELTVYGGRYKFSNAESDNFTVTMFGQPNLSIGGSGVLMSPETVRVWTGCDPAFTDGSTGREYTSPFLSDMDVAYDAANMISAQVVTPSVDLSADVQDGVPRSGYNVGDRYRYQDAFYRLLGEVGDGHSRSWELGQYTTVGDHDQTWKLATVNDHDTFWSGRRVENVRLRPLWTDWPQPVIGSEVVVAKDVDGEPFWNTVGTTDVWVYVDPVDGYYWDDTQTAGALPVLLDDDYTPYIGGI